MEPYPREKMIQVSTKNMRDVSQRPALGVYLKHIWQRRKFIIADAEAKAFATTRDTVMGKTWIVLRPFIDAIMYYLMFGVILGTAKGIDNFPAYLLVGVNFFGFISAGIASGAGIIPSSMSLIRSFTFPKFSLVLSWSWRMTLDFIPVFIVTLLFVLFVPPGVNLHPLMLATIPLFIITWLIVTGMAGLIASVTALIPDIKFIWPLISRAWFFSSGVFFSFENRITDPDTLALVTSNPGYIFLDMNRQLLIYHTMPPIHQWAHMSAWAGILFTTALIVFWRHEEAYSREH